MSAEDEVRRKLGSWLGKAKTIAEPPAVNETKGHLQQPERALSHRGREDDLTQLNYKIPRWKKRHIKQLAVRDNVTLLVMLDEMVDLYEREYGKLDRK